MANTSMRENRQGSLTKQHSKELLLFVTPYAPLMTHGHAADDVGRRIVDSLSSRYDLHVYAPGQEFVQTFTPNGRVTYHPGSAARSSIWRHFLLYPAGLRKDWARSNSAELRALLKSLRPDYIHVEYVQPVESLLRRSYSGTWTLTIHDVTSRVFRQRAQRSRGLQRLYRWVEFARVWRVEEKAIRRAKRIFALSERDAEWATEIHPQKDVVHIKIGIDEPSRLWDANKCDSSVFVFAGAMWRDSNAAAANMLAQQVMPIVRESIPEASLRIVGKDPTPQVQALNDLDNVSVVGAVESIEAEYLRAAVVLAPTLVDAGVLLKALRGLACGAPLIINAAAAIPLEVIDGEHCLVRDSPKEIAAAMIQLATDTRRASKLGRAGLLHVRENFSWESYGQKMTEGIER